MLRHRLRLDFGNAGWRATARAVVKLSPVNMTRRIPFFAQRSGRGRGGPDRIGDGDRSGGALVDADEDDVVLRDHVSHCVDHAITSGYREDLRRKIAELMDVVSRTDR